VTNEELPGALASLREWLEARGFERSYELAPLGWLMLGWTKPTAWVRLTNDRGQWFLDMSRPELGEWFEAEIWRALFEADRPTDATLSEPQIANIARSVVPRLESLAEGNESLRLRLMQLRRSMVR
jgi:hypothetical protein